jgi:hypothetical protein
MRKGKLGSRRAAGNMVSFRCPSLPSARLFLWMRVARRGMVFVLLPILLSHHCCSTYSLTPYVVFLAGGPNKRDPPNRRIHCTLLPLHRSQARGHLRVTLYLRRIVSLHLLHFVHSALHLFHLNCDSERPPSLPPFSLPRLPLFPRQPSHLPPEHPPPLSRPSNRCRNSPPRRLSNSGRNPHVGEYERWTRVLSGRRSRGTLRRPVGRNGRKGRRAVVGREAVRACTGEGDRLLLADD